MQVILSLLQLLAGVRTRVGGSIHLLEVRYCILYFLASLQDICNLKLILLVVLVHRWVYSPSRLLEEEAVGDGEDQ